MKFLKYAAFLLLVQVGSKLWINPKQVVGIESTEYRGVTGDIHVPEYPTRIILVGNANESIVFSDWEFNRVKAALEGAK